MNWIKKNKLYFVLSKTKKAIKFSLLKCKIIGCYLIIKMSMHPSEKKGIILMDICPVSKGSFGDEAVLLSAMQNLYNNQEDISFIQYEDNVGRMFPDYVETITVPFGKKVYQILKYATNFEKVLFFGADIIDGSYGNEIVCWDCFLIKYMRKLGINAKLLNFSISENPSKYALKLLKKILSTNCVCRDKISSERIYAIWKENIKAIPDIAFSLKVRQNPIYEKKYLFCAENIQNVIGININIFIFAEQDRVNAINNYVKLVISLIESGYYIVFIPHDIRKGYNDLDTIQMVLEKIPVCFEKKYEVIRDISSTMEIKFYISKLDYLITGKMHASIAAFSSGVPCSIVGYLGKCEGLVRWLDLQSNVVLNVSDVLEYKSFHTRIYENIQNCIEDKKIICKKKEEMVLMVNEMLLEK